MKNYFPFLLCITASALFGAASDDTFEQRLIKFNLTVQSGDLPAVLGEHERLRGTSQQTYRPLGPTPAERASAENPDLLKLLATQKPEISSAVLAMFQPRSEIYSALRSKNWEKIELEAANLEADLTNQFDSAIKKNDIAEIMKISMEQQRMFPSTSMLAPNKIQIRNATNPTLLRVIAQTQPTSLDLASLFPMRSDIARAIRNKDRSKIEEIANELDPILPEAPIKTEIPTSEEPKTAPQATKEDETYAPKTPVLQGALFDRDLSEIPHTAEPSSMTEAIEVWQALNPETLQEQLASITTIDEIIEMITYDETIEQEAKTWALAHLYDEQERRSAFEITAPQENTIQRDQELTDDQLLELALTASRHEQPGNDNPNQEEEEDPELLAAITESLALQPEIEQPDNATDGNQTQEEEEDPELTTAIAESLAPQPQREEQTQPAGQPQVTNTRLAAGLAIGSGLTAVVLAKLWSAGAFKNLFKK